jgi:hypothetical protein
MSIDSNERFALLPVMLTLLFVSCATCGAAEIGSVLPAPRALLVRTLQAHRDLGPSYVAAKRVNSGAPAYPDDVSNIRMRRNNAHQFVMWSVSKRDTSAYFVTGGWVIDYWQRGNTYMKTRLEDPFDADHALFGTLFHIREALANSAEHPQLSRTRVLSITYHGLRCYEVIWDMSLADDEPLRHPPAGYKGPLPGAYIAPFRVLVVGRNDGLVRKVIRDASPPWKTETQTLSYHLRRHPYPASTFVFVPPPGTKQEVGL